MFPDRQTPPPWLTGDRLGVGGECETQYLSTTSRGCTNQVRRDRHRAVSESSYTNDRVLNGDRLANVPRSSNTAAMAGRRPGTVWKLGRWCETQHLATVGAVGDAPTGSEAHIQGRPQTIIHHRHRPSGKWLQTIKHRRHGRLLTVWGLGEMMRGSAFCHQSGMHQPGQEGQAGR